jgi:3-hydroxy-9,10-secoandrosta-1,3,5(10)-triene-9,17-dione monooxygenase reductase component
MSVPSAIDAKLFRNALGSFTTGVTIVTTRDGVGADVGLTANSFNSVSLDPPMVLWSLGKNSTNLAAFEAAQYFAVHILAADQDGLSTRFAKSGTDKFDALRVGRGHGGVPLIDGCTARFECRTAFKYEGGDHVIFVGEVLTFDHNDGPPLVFHGGRYARVVRQSSAVGALATGERFREGFLGYLLGRASGLLFRGLQQALSERGLVETDFQALIALGEDDRQSASALTALLDGIDSQAVVEVVRRLRERGLVRLDLDDAEDAPVVLTEAGRHLMVELLAVAKAAEAEIEEHLDHSEILALKDLLKRVVARAGPATG